MRQCSGWIVVLLLANLAAFGSTPAVRGFRRPALTSPPFTYCIDYNGHPTKPDYLAAIAASPPDLYHVGYHIPFKGMLGPTYGHDLFTNTILPPDEVPREVARVRDVIAKMREAGVGRLIPYVYSMAFFGDPKARTGYFRFYDHWNDYAAFGLGPKPSEDPATWRQTPAPEQLESAPPRTLHYQPCVNNPAWSRYLDVVVRELAKCGYDGMFFDVNTEYCNCRYCNARFRAYLLHKYGPAGLRAAFGVTDVRRLQIPTIYGDFEKTITSGFPRYIRGIWKNERLDQVLAPAAPRSVKLDEDWRLLRCYMQGSLGEYPPSSDFAAYLRSRFGATTSKAVPVKQRSTFVQTVLRYHFHRYLRSSGLSAELMRRFGSADIRRRCCERPAKLLLWVEAQRFWADSMSATFARLKRVGRAQLAAQGRSDDFFTVANAGSIATLDGDEKRRVDGIDIARWAPNADLQMLEEMQQCGTLPAGGILSNYFGLRWAEATGTHGGTLLYCVGDERAADLAEAEVAANGGGAFIQPSNHCPESRARWKQFFREHADLWRKGTSIARVGLTFFHDQLYYENSEHGAQVRRIAASLAENQVPFDLVVEENLRDLDRYDVICVPELRYLRRSSAEALLAYARHGGRLVVIGDFRSFDELARPATKILRPTTAAHVTRLGRGVLLRFPYSAVPRRAADFWNMMEERASAFVRARNYMEKARRAANARGDDEGARFVSTLERDLGVRLRWCPPGTPAGVYVTGYRLPASPGAAERIVVHLANYNLPVSIAYAKDDNELSEGFTATKSGAPVEVTGLELAVPIPRAWRSCTAPSALTPTEPPASVAVAADAPAASRISLAVSRCATFQAVVLERAR